MGHPPSWSSHNADFSAIPVKNTSRCSDHLNCVNGLLPFALHVCRLAVSSTTALERGTQRWKRQPQWCLIQEIPHGPEQPDIPAPDKLTSCGLPPPLSLTDTSALRDPTAC